MKAPAFQLYAAEYLADEQVMLMSLEAEGAYVRLLSLCWREGSIPANPLLLAAMCKHADQKVIKEVVPCFTKAGAPSGRLIHKRLEEERGKQEAYRAKQSAKGLMGGRPRKADDKPEESHGKATALPQLNHGLTTVKPVISSSASTSTSTSFSKESTFVPALVPEKKIEEALPLNAPALDDALHTRGRAATLPPLRFLTFAQTPYATEAGLAQLAAELKLPDANAAYYLAQIALKAGREDNRTPEAWHTYAARWLSNDARRGQLITNTIQLTDNSQRHAIAPRNLSPSQRAQFVPDVTSYGTL